MLKVLSDAYLHGTQYDGVGHESAQYRVQLTTSLDRSDWKMLRVQDFKAFAFDNYTVPK